MTAETLLKKTIKDYLKLTGWFAFSILQGLGAVKGISDLIAVKQGHVLFIEVKAARGRQSNHQKKFEKNIVSCGGHYILAYSVEDIENYIVDNFGEKKIL